MIIRNKIIDNITKKVVAFFGSWLSVIIHGAIFAVWLTSGRDIDLLTMWVSLEAIFLSIFILMAESHEQASRDERERKEAERELRLVRHDAQTDDQALKEILLLKAELKEMNQVITSLLKKK